MAHQIDDLLSNLRSPDLLTRIRACTSAGSTGDAKALPLLKRHVAASHARDAEDVCVAVRAIGQLLGLIAKKSSCELSADFGDNCRSPDSTQGIDDTAQVNGYKEYYEFLLTELSIATGRYCSSIIFSLCLAGPSVASPRATILIADAVSRNNVEQMRYRAYQYVSLICPELLNKQPWIAFSPTTSELLNEWDIKTVLRGYGL